MQTRGRGDARAWALAAAIGVVCIGLFWALRIHAAGLDASFDHAEFMWPAYTWNAEQIRAGTLPLWNPFALAGRPTLATLQGGLLHPLHLVYLALPARTGIAVSTLLHLALAGGGALWLARRLGLGAAPGLLAVLLLCLRGSHPGAGANVAMLESLAWLAPGFVAVHAITRGRWRGGALGVAACVALSLLAGFPQMTLYAVYAWAFTAMAVPIIERRPPRDVARSVAACGLGVGLGAAMAAAQLLPALELAGEGIRAREVLTLHRMYPFGLAGYETAGAGLAHALAEHAVVPELWLSFGVVGLLLAPLSLLARPQRAWTVTLGVIAALTLGVAAGPASPVFDLYLALPELASFRMPARVLAVTDLCFAMLAAIGLDAAMRWLARRERPGWLARVPLGAAVVAAAVLEIFMAPSPDARADAAARIARFERMRSPSPMLEGLRHDPARTWVWESPGDDRLPWRGLSMLGIRSLSDYDALFTRRESEYLSFLVWGETERFGESTHGRFTRPYYGRTRVLGPDVRPAGVLERRRLAEVAGAAHVLVERGLVRQPPFEAVLSGPTLTGPSGGDERHLLFEAPRALPRALVTHRVRPAPPAPALLDAMSRADFDPRALSYVEDEAGEIARVLATPAATAAAREHVAITHESLHTVEIAARLEARGLVVLADADYPGWQAFVDGEAAPIWPTNHLFRGVVVDAGEHTLRFEYRPSSFRHGALLSLASIATWITLARTEARARRNQRLPTS